MNVEGEKSSFEIPCSIFGIQNGRQAKAVRLKTKVLNLANGKIKDNGEVLVWKRGRYPTRWWWKKQP